MESIHAKAKLYVSSKYILVEYVAYYLVFKNMHISIYQIPTSLHKEYNSRPFTLSATTSIVNGEEIEKRKRGGVITKKWFKHEAQSGKTQVHCIYFDICQMHFTVVNL